MICQQDGSPDWSALEPDASGSYKDGTWAPIAPMSIWRRYYASAVLASGKVLVAGGEDAPTGDTNVCEIYDPVQDSWTLVPPPPGWANIGDAPCAVLPDGRVLVGDINSTRTVIYDPVANTWFGTGTKGDVSSEETWTLLRDGGVLTVECKPTYPKASQRYIPATGTWVDAGSTQADLVAHAFSTEIGPAVLLEDGRVIAFGGTGHTAIYAPDHGAGVWSAGPDFPLGTDGQLMTVATRPRACCPTAECSAAPERPQAEAAGRAACILRIRPGQRPARSGRDSRDQCLSALRRPDDAAADRAGALCLPQHRYRHRHPSAAGSPARRRSPGTGNHRRTRSPDPRQPPQGIGTAIQRSFASGQLRR